MLNIITKKRGGDRMTKQRVVIEVNSDDYEALLALKQIAGLGWRDILVAGAVYWIGKLQFEEKIEKLRQIKIKEEANHEDR